MKSFGIFAVIISILIALNIIAYFACFHGGRSAPLPIDARKQNRLPNFASSPFGQKLSSKMESPYREEKLYSIGKDIVQPAPITQPLPPYTMEARKARIEGVVLLQAIVRNNGTIDSFKVIRGLGFGLDESAINTISTKWHFRPGTRNGKPVDVIANIEVRFRMF
jgi:TonB family protein